MKAWKPFFIWKGISSVSMGIEVLTLPPITKPKQRMEEVVVPGRHGVFHLTDETFEPTLKSIEICLRGELTDRVFKWLKGSGEVIFSNEPGRKYAACVIDKIQLEHVIRRLNRGLVQFNCQPFKYEVNQSPIEITRPQTVYSKGNIESEPVLTVYGEGDIAISINGRVFSLIGVSDFVVVDTPTLTAYKNLTESANNRMAGEFPYFDLGGNEITWSGNVDKIVILANWRWL